MSLLNGSAYSLPGRGASRTPDVSDQSDQQNQNFRAGREAGPNDVFIAVMGVTGSGKSSFISRCSGKVVKVGHQLEACTTHVDVYAYEASPAQTVYLIDTPGFDDTNRSDTEVLKEIARWLVASYKGRILLNGIIYLHRITDIRMQGSARKNLIMFRQLCGENALKRVALVTTMWDKVPEDEAAQRERELIDTPEFWGWMLGKGSSCQRHYNTEDSARIIVSELAGYRVPVTTDLQKQMVDERKELSETSAGQELQSEMNKEKAKWAQERREIEEQLRLAIEQRDHEAEEMMREERDRYTKMIQKVEKDTEALKATMNKLLAERDERVTTMEQMMKRQEAGYREELQDIRQRQRQLEKGNAELLARHRRKEPSRVRLPLRANEETTPRGRHLTAISFSMVIQHGGFMCIGPRHNASSAEHPQMVKDGYPISFVAWGDTFRAMEWTWIAHYPGYGWRQSLKLGLAYPELASTIGDRGLETLELCSLGPKGTYYARWTSGFWESNVSEEIIKVLLKAQKDGYTVKAIALGYGESYVISFEKTDHTADSSFVKAGDLVSSENADYPPKPSSNTAIVGAPGHTTRPSFSMAVDLKGYYGNFSQHKRFKRAKILAVALDLNNTTDFLMVHTYPLSSDINSYFTRHVSNSESKKKVDEWWLKA